MLDNLHHAWQIEIQEFVVNAKHSGMEGCHHQALA
jgi:hypothetical protein